MKQVAAQIENKRSVKYFNLLIAAAFLACAAAIILRPLLGIPVHILRAGLPALLIALAGSMFLARPSYLLAVFLPNRLEIRYYNTFLRAVLMHKTKEIKILKTDFAGYDYQTRNFGLGKSLLLKERQGSTTVTYPPLSLFLLSPAQRRRLFDLLDSLTKN